jgi:hypothetical protein
MAAAAQCIVNETSIDQPSMLKLRLAIKPWFA